MQLRRLWLATANPRRHPHPPHRYAERLALTRPVTIRAAADEAVEVVWETQQPYQATVEAGPELGEAAVVLQGLRIRQVPAQLASWGSGL